MYDDFELKNPLVSVVYTKEFGAVEVEGLVETCACDDVW